MIGPIAAAFLASAPAAAEAPPLVRAQAELRASHQALAPHTDGFFLDKDSRSPALLERHWTAIQRWTESWLEANGAREPTRIAQAAMAADSGLALSMMEIAPGSLVASASENEMGTIFIVRRTPRGFRSAWTISAPGAAALAAYPTLAGWAPAMAVNRCGAHRRHCGPLYAELGRLPPQQDGGTRFYIAASYAQPAGATVAGQLSIWRWDGHKAKPLLADAYAYMIDQPYGVTFAKGFLHVGVKGEFKTLFACAGCNGRQMDWRIAVEPNGVRDLGRRDRYPELVLADDIIGRVSRHRPPPWVAAGVDLSPLRRQVAEAGKDGFGMLMGWTLTRHGRTATLCVSPDPYTDVFTFAKHSRGWRLIAVRARSAQCGPNANS